eukprot:5178078-Lingulodinium_polyedra.AAC.1
MEQRADALAPALQQLGFATAAITTEYGIWRRVVGARDADHFTQHIRRRAAEIDVWPRAGPRTLGR